MESFQKKALKYLEDTCSTKLKGIDLDIEQSYSNTGAIYFRKGFKTLASLNFSFQSDYATLTFKVGKGSQEICFYIDYKETEKFPEAVIRIIDVLRNCTIA